MYAVITSPIFWKDIEQVITSTGEELLFQSIDKNIDLFEELEKVSRIAVKTLIIDISAIADQNKLKQAIMNYKIKREKTRIIIIAPNSTPGDQTISYLFSLGIWDILNPTGEREEELTVFDSLNECLSREPSYPKGVKWFTGLNYDTNGQATNASKPEKDGPERTVIIEKDKILGTCIIAVAGANRGIGCTHAALSIGNYLSQHKNKFKVALIELNEKNDTQEYNISCPQALKDGSFTFNDIDFYNRQTSLIELITLNYYDYIILDIGQLKTVVNNNLLNSKYYSEFIRATLSILVCGSQPWQTKDIGYCLYKDLGKKDNSDSINWKLLFNLTDEQTFKKLTRNIDWPAYNFPYSTDIFNTDTKKYDILTELLNNYIPQTKRVEKKRFSLFKK